MSIRNANIIRLKLIPTIGNKTIFSLLDQVPELSTEVLQKDLIFHHLSIKQQEQFNAVAIKLESLAEKVFKDLESSSIQFVSYFEEEYPESLKKIYEPPVLLFYKGNLVYDYHTSLAIVGSRKCTNYGEHICQTFISRLGQYNFTIISGLAMGVDAVAHHAAVEYKCKCIGVIGNGLNHIYPYSNKSLYSKILDSNGCILTEFLPDTEPHPAFFPLRNRIIAGLSRGTLVVEAAEKSGSLITAHRAFEENREVYAIPADINRIQSAGCNRLIRNQIAKLVIDPEDIITEYGIHSTYEKAAYDIENHPYKEFLQLITFNKLTSDELSIKTGKQVHDVNAILTELEMEGLVLSDEQMRWVRI